MTHFRITHPPSPQRVTHRLDAVATWLLLLATLSLVPLSTARAVNLIEVESKTVVAGATGVPIHIRIVNEDTLSYLSLPLEFKSVDGAFISSIWAENSERIGPGVFTQLPRTERYAEPAVAPCPYQVAEPLTTTLPVAGTPEGLLILRSACGNVCNDYLNPGVDVDGSFVITVDVGLTLGSFEIDTTCATGNRLAAMGEGVPTNLVFNKGVITVVASAPDTLYVDTTGNDITGDGSELSPLRTIQKAIDSLASIVSTPSYIFVGPGNYDAPVVYPSGISLTVKSLEGPFLTHIVGDSSGNPGVTSAVVMESPNPGDVLVLDGFTVRNNRTTTSLSGGGITVMPLTNGTIRNCIIRDNRAQFGAGGIEYQGEGGTIANNWVVNNHFIQIGDGVGGIYLNGSADVTFVNNTIAGNTTVSMSTSSGVHLDITPMASSHFPESYKREKFGSVDAAAANDAVLQFDNNIIAYNQPSFGYGAPAPLSDVFYNNLYFGNGEDNNTNDAPFDPLTLILDAPLFADTTARDYHLTCLSPAINAGRDLAVPPGLFGDIDGQSRFGPAASPVDIGADEFYDDTKIAQFTAAPLIGCVPFDVTFDNQSIYCVDEGMEWRFGDGGSVFNVLNPQHTYTVPGVYSVTLIVEGQDAADTLTIPDYVTVLDPPVVDFAADTLYGCGVLVVHLTATTTSTVDQYLWRFGDGDSAIGNPVLHQYDDPGTFDVELEATNICGVDTVLKQSYIELASPFAMDFSSSDYFECDSLTAQFSALVSSPVNQFYWDFGDPLFPDPVDDSGQIVTHTYRQQGKYTVTLWASNICETDTVRKVDLVEVGGPPTVFITSSHDTATGPTCDPYTVQFDYTSTQPLNTFLWDFGDNTTSTEARPTHVYTVGGINYSVQLTASGTCGGDVAQRTNYIAVTKRPTAVLTADTTVICAGSLPVTLNATIDGAVSSAAWHCGDGEIIPGPIAQHTYAQIGLYRPFFVMNHQCGSDTTYLTDTITVADLPLAEFSASPLVGYDPMQVTFTDESENVPSNWSWDFGDAHGSTLQSPVHMYESPGVYTVRQAIGNPCGADTLIKTAYITVGGFNVSVDSLGTKADTILYTVDVDTSVIAYDHAVLLQGRLTFTPTRGNMTFVFVTSSAQPPFSTTMKAVPVGGLASGSYTIEVTANDPARNAKIATIPINYSAQQLLVPSATALSWDSVIVTFTSSQVISVRNNAPSGSGLLINVSNPQTSGSSFGVQGTGGTLAPQQKFEWPVLFTPLRKGPLTGELRITSNDPAQPLIRIPLSGKGIGEQGQPTLVSRTSTELGIDQPIQFDFSEAMAADTSDTILTVRSGSGSTVNGRRVWTTNRRLQFRANGFLPADDSLSVVLRGTITDTNGNFLDGNMNNIEEKSPLDDIAFTLPTGPGVYPGDADNDGAVNERDVLALGRYYGLSGPSRSNSQPGFTIQPATAWNPRAATYADADGDGDVDSMDICPIAEFFDNEVNLPKAAVDAWLADVSAGSHELVGSLLNALDACPNGGAGQSTLHRFLSEMQGPAAVPQSYSLGQNYPNPFNPSTLIRYSLSEPTRLRLEVFDVLGRRVRILEESPREAGVYHVVWDGLDDNGQPVASGIYFYRLSAPHFHATRKMVLLR